MLQVHLNKLECREKVHFLLKLISKSETFIYFRFITYKVKHKKKIEFWGLELTAHESQNQYLKILEYLHLSFN